jgi:hypothetical protein
MAPPNVLKDVKYPDMIDAATRGINIGKELLKLPLQARQEQTQMAHEKISQAVLKQAQQEMKDELANATEQGRPVNYWPIWLKYGLTQSDINPVGGYMSALDIQQKQQNIAQQNLENTGLNVPNPLATTPANQQSTSGASAQPGNLLQGYLNYIGAPGAKKPGSSAPVKKAAPAGGGKGGDDKDLMNQIGMTETQQPAQLAGYGLPALGQLASQQPMPTYNYPRTNPFGSSPSDYAYA